MSIVRLVNVGAGVMPDMIPEDLADGIWSEARNVSFAGGVMERAKGFGQIITPTVLPYGLLPYRTSTKRFLISLGLAKAYVTDGGTETEITKAGGDYTGTAANRWTACVFQGIAIANNGVEQPQYWGGNTANDFANLTGWTSTTKVAAMRAYKQFLVGINCTESGTAYPYKVMWSDAADPGSLPSWTVSTGTLAGSQELPSIGPLVDGAAMGDEFIVYSTSGAFSMRFIGGTFVMSFRPLPGVPGVLTQNCIAETPIGHVYLSTGDVILHAGGQSKSIADGRVRRAIFDSISNLLSAQACFVTTDPTLNQVWICYPEVGQTYCNKAAVWNWIDDSWTFRDLRNATAGASGQFPELNLNGTYATTTLTYATATGTTYGGDQNPDLQRMVMAFTGPAIAMVGADNADLTFDVDASATRVGMSIGDPQRMKLIRAVWPRVQATAGTEIEVCVGASQAPDVDPTWQDPVTFTVGTDSKVDTFASGRYLALKVRTTADAAWRIRGIDMDIVPLGEY